MDSRTDEELLADIKEMRRYLRAEHKDLRVNAQCWATSWEYISEEMRRRKSGVYPPLKDVGGRRERNGLNGARPQSRGSSSQASSPLTSFSEGPSDEELEDLSEVPSSSSSSEDNEEESTTFPGLKNPSKTHRSINGIQTTSNNNYHSDESDEQPVGSSSHTAKPPAKMFPKRKPPAERKSIRVAKRTKRRS